MGSELVTGESNADWKESIRAFAHPRVLTMLFLGFSAGLPLMLIFSSISFWLLEAGVDRSVVTYFSWAALGYSFKFIWAPLVDTLPLPVLNATFGRRRSWILLAQFMVITAIVVMANLDPAQSQTNLTGMALAAVLLGFSSATQDIVIDAYRIESAETRLQAMMSATYIAGYRIGMLVAGAGALYLASYFGSAADAYSFAAWQNTYYCMAAAMGVGVITTLVIPEPDVFKERSTSSASQSTQIVFLFICCVAGFIFVYVYLADLSTTLHLSLMETLNNKSLVSLFVECLKLASGVTSALVVSFLLTRTGLVDASILRDLYLNPVSDFFQRYGFRSAWMLLALIGLYRISDIVLGVIANVFYHDIGYSKNEVATVAKAFGLGMTIFGGFLGGLLSMQFGVMRILLLGAVLSAVTNLLFMVLAGYGYSIGFLYVVIGADNLSAGLASAAFVAFLSALTNIKFTAMQFAIFTSLMTLIPKVLGGYSGGIVNELGYSSFFLITALLGVPVILLILLKYRDPRFAR
jgi:PAT family beta-lactamase induction signal transducer AmpG